MEGWCFFGVLIVVGVDLGIIMGDFFFEIKGYIEELVFPAAIGDRDAGKKRGLRRGDKVGYHGYDARMG
jgi:hypothetical protein